MRICEVLEEPALLKNRMRSCPERCLPRCARTRIFVDSAGLRGQLQVMENFININDWIGPVMALGAIFTGAGILVGEAVWNSLFGED